MNTIQTVLRIEDMMPFMANNQTVGLGRLESFYKIKRTKGVLKVVEVFEDLSEDTFLTLEENNGVTTITAKYGKPYSILGRTIYRINRGIKYSYR